VLRGVIEPVTTTHSTLVTKCGRAQRSARNSVRPTTYADTPASRASSSNPTTAMWAQIDVPPQSPATAASSSLSPSPFSSLDTAHTITMHPGLPARTNIYSLGEEGSADPLPSSAQITEERRSRSRAARRQVRESVTSRRRQEGDDPPGGPRVGDEAAQRRIRMGRVVANLAHQAEAEGIWAENGVAGPTIPFFFFCHSYFKFQISKSNLNSCLKFSDFNFQYIILR
jgi:hypothetical protein